MADPHRRLVVFRERHPGVTIGRAPRGRWDATVPLPRDGKGYWRPRPLTDLLDTLEAELDSKPRASPG
jgi:hypothetical protein